MKNVTRRPKAVRFLSMLLAFLMVFSCVPAKAEAAGTITTNKTTYELGEPIYVKATGNSGVWAGLYNKGDQDDDNYWFWFYVNEEEQNIYDTWYYPNNGSGPYDGTLLKADDYEIRLSDDSVDPVYITIEDPDLPEATMGYDLAIEKTTVPFGEPIKIKTTAYTDGAWVGIYTDEEIDGYDSLPDTRWYYVGGQNGAWIEKSLAAGNYTVVLFGDSGKSNEKERIEVTVTESDASFLSVDKTSYAFTSQNVTEPINVTVNYPGNWWVGLYKAGDTPGGPKSFYWYDQSWTDETVDITTTYEESGRIKTGADNEFIAGDYKLILFSGDSYNQVESIDITLTKSEAGRKTVDPTCENDGTITISYTDGTTETLANGTSKGHAYGDFKYDGVAAKTHTKTCANDVAHKITDACTFDDGEVTKPATTTENGEKTYTCSVCKGTYTETISMKQEVSREENPEAKATCEKDGEWIITYDDGSTGTAVKPKLNHNYGGWTYNNDKKTHTKICSNNTMESCVLTEDCDFEGTGSNGTMTYTCADCEGSYSVEELKVNKTTFAYGEPILVTADYNNNKSWVGLYKKGESYDSNYGGALSIYWYYVLDEDKSVDRRGQQITLSSSEYVQSDRPDDARKLQAGEYKVVLFSDDGYNALHTIDITITKKQVGDPVRVEPKCEEDGSITINYDDGSKDETVLPQTGHDWGEEQYDETGHAYKVCKNDASHVKYDGECTFSGWVYDNTTKTHSRVCNVSAAHIEKEDCDFGKGVSIGNNKFKFTCSVCEGFYESGYLTTDKTSYKLGEPIMVTAVYDGEASWVGLYPATQTEYKPEMPAYRWYEIVNTEGGVNRYNQTVDLYLENNSNVGIDRFSLENDEYKVILFGDGGYGNIIAQTNITIDPDTSDVEFGMSINGKECELGDHLEFKDGESIRYTVTADGPVGQSWLGFYNGFMDITDEFSGYSSFYYLEDDIDVEYDLKADWLGDKLKAPGKYTLVIFGNGNYDDPRFLVTFEITKEIESETITKKPTCTRPGLKDVVYKDGTTEKNVIVDALDHDTANAKYEFNAEKKTHSKVCKRVVDDVTCNTAITSAENCKFDGGVDAGDNKVKYTCSVCDGSYTVDKGTTPPGDDDEDPDGPEVDKDFKDDNVYRIFGSNRFKTSLAIADRIKEIYKQTKGMDKFDTVIIANGMNFADALAGSYLSTVKNAPILMMGPNNAADIQAYVQENVTAGGMVYVLGGTAAIPDARVSGISAAGYTVKRLAGSNRYATNLEILKESGVTNEEILVCTGTGFADSLSASAAGKPILLVGKSLNADQKAYLSSIPTSKFTIIGGTGAVSEAVEAEIRAYGKETSRLGGKNRYETSVMIAKAYVPTPNDAVLAFASNFPDGLCGGPLAVAMGSPLILTKTGQQAPAAAYARETGISVGAVLGGAGLVSDGAVQEIFGMDASSVIIELN